MASTREVETFSVQANGSAVATKWKRWLRAFELYMSTRNVVNPQRKRDFLLHTAGLEVQDIYYTFNIEEEEGTDIYKETIKRLDEYFKPTVNEPYERLLFRSITQQDNESVNQFYVRLKQQAQNCAFGDMEDQMIRDQIIEKIQSSALRQKLLEEGRNLTLQRALELIRLGESSQQHTNAIEHKEETVNRIQSKQNHHGSMRQNQPKAQGQPKESYKCHRCGYTGHYAADKKCPAWGKTCEKCGLKDHFQIVCKTKKGAKARDKGRRDVRQVEEEDEVHRIHSRAPTEQEGQQKEYAFGIRAVQESENDINLKIKMGGVQTEMLIDSGATCNIIGRRQWEYLKSKGIKCESYKSNKILYAYGSKKPLEILGAFETKIELITKKTAVNAEVVVLDGEGGALLGKETALRLGVLKIETNINAVEQNRATEGWNKEFKDVFTGLGKLKDFQLQIPIKKDFIPVAQPVRRLPYHLRDIERQLVNELLELDIIERVEGPTPWVSPTQLVPKTKTKWRLCIDMRRANEAIERERFPIRTIEETLQSLNGSKIYSKLDIKWAYHQIELSEESREITTFCTSDGLFRYKRLMFGVNCAPEMYQRVIMQTLQGCKGVVNYLDDIVVHGQTQEEHDGNLRKVLQILEEKGLTLNGEKCQFSCREIKFLGHHISEKGIRPTENSIEAVLEFRTPENAEEVRSFLGLINFSSRFIPDLATTSEPLRRLTKKNHKFEWNKEQERAFQELKKAIVRPGTLGFFQKGVKTQVIADASPVGLGAVLIQIQKDGPRVIKYVSKALSDVEKRYSQTEKEALALVWACEKFHLYLYGSEFDLITDHKPLEVIFGPRSKPCARIERWVLRLLTYKYRVIYKPGRSNIADPLSRLLDLQGKPKVEEIDLVRVVVEAAVPKTMTLEQIKKETEVDEEIQKIKRSLETNKWEKEHKMYEVIQHELGTVDDILVRGTRIILPRSLHKEAMELAHEGHLGIVGMKQRLRTKVWWTTLAKDVEKWCKSCHGCQLVGAPDPPEPMTRTTLPSGPWELVSMDFLGPLPSGHYLLVLVDYYSRFYEVEIMMSITASKLLERLKVIFARYGIPNTIISDNGRTFIEKEFKAYMEEHGIHHHYTTPLWPSANGEVERQNRSIEKRLRIAQATGKDWKEELWKYLFAYRTTPHNTTGVTPAELMFKRNIRTKLPDLTLTNTEPNDEEIRDRDRLNKGKGKIYADDRRNAKPTQISEGDLVLIQQQKRNKLTTPFKSTPLTVVQKDGNSIVAETPDGTKYRRNSTHFKKYVERQDADEGKVENNPTELSTTKENTQTQPEPRERERPKRNIKTPNRFNDYDLT
ncbi:uncharacterized protein K02A2.6-like [Diprion similis]|uniref:uncharacterized protein K02A2.6-like n=1 Tax=Diprion similis TaxID=362088 RepID=UPI001EF7639F|nr:uncharacterized protein K02A2.6-like [Diprion similis]